MDPLNKTDIFTRALGLKEPWHVTNVEMLPSQKNPLKLEVHISVDWKEGSKFSCPVCGEEGSVYDSNLRTFSNRNLANENDELPASISTRSPLQSLPASWALPFGPISPVKK